ncbi:MAG: pilus assembly protein [Lachnospiraceae bacterium]
MKKLKKSIISTKLKASATIEMAYIMPVILLVFVAAMCATFYYHDKNILKGIIYETTTIGSEYMRIKDGPREEQLERFFQQRIQGKLILFRVVTAKIYCMNKEVTITVNASKGVMKLKLQGKMAVTEPEKRIREIRRLKEQIK